MRKIVIPIFVLLFLLLFSPNTVSAVDELTFDGDTNIEISDLDITLVVKDGSVADSMTVNTGNVQFTLSDNSEVTITSAGKYTLTNTSEAESACAGDVSKLILSGTGTVTVTPNTGQTCGSSGGDSSTPSATPAAPSNGAAAPTTPTTPTMPTTSTGEVTATASAGGKTTLTTDDNTTALVEVPINTVSASTVFKVSSEAKDTVVSSRAIPSAKKAVGSYVYNYTATFEGEAVTSFDKSVTITIGYTDEQISDLKESSLKVYYWKEATSEWTSLTSTVNRTNNTVTAATDHFTYFIILGEEGVEDEPEVTEVTIIDGDLIRNPNAAGMAQFDIHIVKLVGSKKFKRLILSPHVFESYEHFDKNANGSPWDDVQDVAQSVMDEYTTSDLVRAVGDSEVYKLTPTGDTGTKQWLNMTISQFETAGYDWDSIYEINATDRDAYITGTEIAGTGGGSATGGETIIIKTANLRIRSLPSLSGDSLGFVHQGEVYDLLDEQDGWYKITTTDNITGWCYGGDTGGYAAKQ